jgi:CBS domain containing-hemolysin-like protein
MSDFRAQPAPVVRDEAEASSQDEAGSSSTAPKPENGKSGSSFWSRAARIWRAGNASSLREDLTDALMTGAADGDTAFSPAERAMLNNILRFREIRVEDVMVPRADIEAVDLSITIGELMVIFEESGRSRMPVYSESLDDPRGMVHIRDLLS